MILQKSELIRRIEHGDIIVSDGAQIAPNSIDLRLSRHVWRLRGWYKYDGRIVPLYKYIHAGVNQYFKFKPGLLYICATEQICGSRPGSGLVPVMYGRSSTARMGLQIHAAGLGEEGFLNRWAMEVITTSPSAGGAYWYFDEPICQITFDTAAGEGVYNGQYKQPEHAKTADEILAAWSPLALLPSCVRGLAVHTAQVANHAAFVGGF